MVRGTELVRAGRALSWSDPTVTDLVGGGSFVLPTGTVAFLLTDIEGSSRRWESEAEAMQAAMACHARILDAAVSAHGGVRPPAQGEGDSIVAAFSRASDAVLAALDAQRAFAVEEWPTSNALRVRMAVHSGEARFVDDGNYAGQAIIRTARLRAIAHGGQVLVSAPARDLTVDQLGDTVTFIDLGEHRLRDLSRPERVYQLTDPAIPADFPPLRSLDSHLHNLPIQLSSFIGRVDETATVASLVEANRLVTITGAGGSGKTRLALQAAAQLVDHWPDGTWWVELAELADPDTIAITIGAALRVSATVGEGAAEALAEVVADQRLLIALDNCEHLAGPVAKVVDRLLRRCPRISVLTTSRVPLEVDGEVAWRIPPLQLPEPSRDADGPVEGLCETDSVRLFVDRAQRVRPNFRLDDNTTQVVADICARLDGIPLAIELAAARVRSLTPAQIIDGLADAFRLLTGTGRVALPRQHTLEASITWSHQLLAPDEQVLLRRMAAFNGGCTLDDAEAVVGDDELPAPAVLDLMDQLVAQSLVTLDDQGATARYRMLETVRQYAQRQLDLAGESEPFRARHADHYLGLALQLGPQLEGRDEHIPLARLLADHDNLRTALGTLTSAGRWRDVADVCAALAHLWETVAPAEGLAWLSAALDHTDRSDYGLCARLLVARAYIHLGGGNFIEMAADAQRALIEGEAGGDDATAGRAAGMLATAVAWTGMNSADLDIDQAAERCRKAGDRYGEVFASIWPILTAIAFGDPDSGWRRSAAARPLVAALGNHMMTAVHRAGTALGHCYQGDYDAADPEIEAAESSLAIIADSAGVHRELLLRRSLPGALALFGSTYSELGRRRPTSLERLDRLIVAARAEGCTFAELLLSNIAGVVALQKFERDAVQRATDLVARAQELGIEAIRANAVWVQACAFFVQGDLVQVKALLDGLESPHATAMPHYQRARNRHLRSALLLAKGELRGAEEAAHDALSVAVQYTFRWEAACGLELLAGIATANQSWTEATRLFGAAARLRDDFNIRLAGLRRDRRNADDRAELRKTLGDDGFEAAFAEGYALSLDEGAEYAQRARGERKRPTVGWDSLTPTELQVVEHVRAGLTNPQIAEKLLMSRETVKTHLSHVFTKLGVRTRTELATAAAKREAVSR